MTSKPKIVTIWPFTEKFADTWPRVVLDLCTWYFLFGSPLNWTLSGCIMKTNQELFLTKFMYLSLVHPVPFVFR